MKRIGRWAIASAVFCSSVAAASAGCGTNGESCDCADPQITINVPADIASSITIDAIQLSGPACTDVTPTCTNQTNGCTAYAFTANAAGACIIQVNGAGTAFNDQLTIVAQTGCCTGFYPSSSSAAQVDVPEPGDAG
jgi:hypothetical protein